MTKNVILIKMLCDGGNSMTVIDETSDYKVSRTKKYEKTWMKCNDQVIWKRGEYKVM